STLVSPFLTQDRRTRIVSRTLIQAGPPRRGHTHRRSAMFRSKKSGSQKGDVPFSDRVRVLLAGARDEANRLRHEYVGTEHILLSLIRQSDSRGAQLLVQLGVSLERVAQRVEKMVRKGKSIGTKAELPYTSRAKKVLEHALRSAWESGAGYVGTEHLLLGLAAAGGVAAEVLGEFGATADVLKAAVAAGGEAPRAVREAAARAAAAPRFQIRIDDSAAVSIYEQIIGQIQEAVATGQLRPGDRLPTVRRLADDLDIAPGTVAGAYGELERLGILVTEGARGTRVAEQQKPLVPDAERPDTLVGLLRPVAVAAFHLGASAAELRAALEEAMKGIYEEPAA